MHASARFMLTRLISLQSIQFLMNRSAKEDPLLDGLRGISVLMVVFFHSIYGVFYIFKDPERLQQFIGSIPSWAQAILATINRYGTFTLKTHLSKNSRLLS